MFGIDFEINLFSLFIAAGFYIMFGALWFSPWLFGKKWAKLSGKGINDISTSSFGFAISILGTLFTVFIQAHIIWLTGASNIAAGAFIGFWVWLGFNFLPALTNGLWGSKSWGLIFIETGYHLIGLVISGMIIVGTI